MKNVTVLQYITSPIEQLIELEIAWHLENTDSSVSGQYASGFIAGLRQSQFLARMERES